MVLPTLYLSNDWTGLSYSKSKLFDASNCVQHGFNLPTFRATMLWDNNSSAKVSCVTIPCQYWGCSTPSVVSDTVTSFFSSIYSCMCQTGGLFVCVPVVSTILSFVTIITTFLVLTFHPTVMSKRLQYVSTTVIEQLNSGSAADDSLLHDASMGRMGYTEAVLPVPFTVFTIRLQGSNLKQNQFATCSKGQRLSDQVR